MAGSSSRLLSKTLLLLFIALLIIISFNLPVIFSPQFLKIKNTMEKKASLALDRKVSIASIGFTPYGKMVLSNIKIDNIEIKEIVIRFNALEFLTRSKSKQFNFKGFVVFRKPEFEGPVAYVLNMIVSSDVISIKDLRLEYGKHSVDIKGNVTDYLSDPKAEFSVTSREISAPGMGVMSNLYGEILLSKKELFIKDLNFFLDNFPVGIRCRVLDFKSPEIEFNIMSYPGQIESLRAFNPMNFEISFSGRKIENAVKGFFRLESQRLISVNPRKISYDRIKIDDLSCSFLNKTIFVRAKDVICETGVPKNIVYLNISDFNVSAYLVKSRIYLAGLKFSAYKGAVSGSGSMDLKQTPAGLQFDFKIYGMDLAELARALNLKYELKGSMYFSGIFNSKRDPCLSGGLAVKEGSLSNMQTLKMISDFLNVPSLKSIYSDQMSALVYFFPKSKEVMFDKIIVSAGDVNLKGSVKIKSSKKLNGNLSVRMSTELLKESFRLKLLFFIIGEKLKYQDFEFEIGGFADSPQIRWLSTRFRENVMKYLTEGNKESVEKALEKAIKQIL